jgi:hypothetical protein
MPKTVTDFPPVGLRGSVLWPTAEMPSRIHGTCFCLGFTCRSGGEAPGVVKGVLRVLQAELILSSRLEGRDLTLKMKTSWN